MKSATVIILAASTLVGCDKSSSSGSPTGSATQAKPSAARPDDRAVGGAVGDMMDHMWENQPQPGQANIRLLVQEGGNPLQGERSARGRFKLSAARQGGMSSQNSFNPNANGRYVYDGLDPGSYKISVEDSAKIYKTWTKEPVELKAGAVATFTVDLEK